MQQRETRPGDSSTTEKPASANNLRTGAIIVVFAIWLSGWMPVPPNTLAIELTSGAAAALLGTILLKDRLRGYHSAVRRSLSVIAVLFLICGVLLVFLTRSVGTPVEGALALFHIAGWAAFLRMLSEMLRSTRAGTFRLGAGATVLLALSAWSWGSAASMYFHRGAEGKTANGCILAPTPGSGYIKQISSIQDMRLPFVASWWTGPTGTITLYYHAILVVPDTDPGLYNWSKTRIRFEPLERRLNPYLPDECPKGS